jgi:hypothetical protein
LPLAEAGNDEILFVDDVRGAPEKNAPLPERFPDEWDIALCKVSDAAVDELRAAARGAFAEIVLLEQQDFKPARSGIDRAADTGRPAADHDDVPWPFAGPYLLEYCGPVHWSMID